MRILVNAQQLISNSLEGWGWFSYETLKRITVNNPSVEFIFVFDRQYSKEFLFSDNIIPLVQYPPSRHPLLWWFKFEHLMPRLINRYKPDLFLSPDGFIPTGKVGTKTLSVIHDLNFEHHPEFHTYSALKYYTKYFRLFAYAASRIATVSEFTKRDIVNTYGVSLDKIDVVYNGVNNNFTVLNDAVKRDTMKKYSDNCPYIIYVGAFNSRKNIINLLKAFDLFRSKNDSVVKLVLCGSRKSWERDMDLALSAMLYREDVVFTGRVSSSELSLLVGSALCLSYVSIFEGFGIPIIEAMNAGVPVVTSSTSSMPEISGGAALTVNPDSIENIASSFEAISKDDLLRARLISNGFINAKKYSWDISASLLWSSVIKTIAQPF